MANALIEGREGVQQSEASEEHDSMADLPTKAGRKRNWQGRLRTASTMKMR